ncbi:hypothetical protein GUJ93_ZPchr1327g2807, partial [Zizania palustris]
MWLVSPAARLVARWCLRPLASSRDWCLLLLAICSRRPVAVLICSGCAPYGCSPCEDPD